MKEGMGKLEKIVICTIMIISLLGGSLYVFIQKVPTDTKGVTVEKETEIDLSHIFANQKAWQDTYDKTTLEVEKLNTFKGKLGDREQLLACLRGLDDVAMNLERLSGYVTLSASLDQRNDEARQMQGKVHYLEQQIGGVSALILAEVSRSMSEKELREVSQQIVFKPYETLLEEALDNQENGLDEATISFVNNTYNVLQETQEIYNQMSYADQQTKIEDRRYSMAALYQMEVQGHILYAKYGDYESVVDYLLDQNGVDRPTYEMTKKQVRELLPLLKTYMKKEVQTSGNGEGYYGDPITYEKVPRIIEESFGLLGEGYQAIARQAFEEQWISPFSRPNKEEGAYSLRVYGVHPYIVMNYTGSFDDLGMVAHELGHMIHAQESEKNQPFRTSAPDIMTTEIAASVAQRRVYHYLEQENSGINQHEQVSLWFEQLINNFFYQMMIAEFEEQTHLMVEKGEGLTADKLDLVWGQLSKEYFGDEELTKNQWMTIPHIYGEFYTLQYVSAAVVSDQVLKSLEAGDPKMQKNWLTFLRAGSSQKPYVLTKEILGIDLSQPSSYKGMRLEMQKQIDKLK